MRPEKYWEVKIVKKNTLSKIVALCLASVISLSLLGGIGTSANAASMTESVYVHKNLEIATGVRINIKTYDAKGKADIKQFVPTDVDGNTVNPFIYNGTTYLPVRAVSGVFGATIDWNTFYSSVVIATSKSATKTVVNPNPKPIDSSKATAKYSTHSVVTGVNIYVDNNLYIPTDAGGNKVDVILMNGTTYLPLRAMTKIFLGNDTSDQIKWDGENYTVTISAVPPASGQGGISSDSIIASIIGAMKDKLGSLLKPSGCKDRLKNLIAGLKSGSDSNSSTLSKFKCMFNHDALKALLKNSGYSMGDIKKAFGASSDEDLYSKVTAKFFNSFEGNSMLEKAMAFYVFIRALDRLF